MGEPIAGNLDLRNTSEDLTEDHKTIGEGIRELKSSDMEEKSDLQSRIFAAVAEFMVAKDFNISKLSTLHFFSTSGMDSLDLLELADYISKDLKINLDPTCLIDYPCVQALYNHICGDIYPEPVQEHANLSLDSPITDVLSRSNQSIGIFNSSRRFPTRKADGFSENILGAQDSVKGVPLDRWDPEAAQCHSREAWIPRFGSF